MSGFPEFEPKQKGHCKHKYRVRNQDSLGKRNMCSYNHQCGRQCQQNYIFYTHFPPTYKMSSIIPETLSNLYSLNPSSATMPVPFINRFGSSTVTNFSV